MASLLEMQKKAAEKGIQASVRSKRDVDASSVIGNYVQGYSAEGALKNSVEGLEGFCSYWEEQSRLKLELTSPDQYIEKINTIFSSYRTLRRNIDGTIAYLIGDWLLDCRLRFFPETDRKTRGKWSEYLMANLCKGFEKTTAYEFMAIAEKLKNYRQTKLSLASLKALLRVKNSGVDIDSLDVNTVINFSTKEILALNDRKARLSANQVYTKLRHSLEKFIEESKEIDLNDLDSYESEKLKVSLTQVMSLIDAKCVN